MNKVALAFIKENLKAKGFNGGDLLLCGRRIGRFVTHGHHSGNGKSVYATRVYLPRRIELKARSKGAMLNKLAEELGRIIKRDNLNIEDIGAPVTV